MKGKDYAVCESFCLYKRRVLMINSNAFNYVDILNKATTAAVKRGQVLSNNVANQDTPGYKRKDVRFESYLEAALAGNGTMPLSSRIDEIHENLNVLDATVYTDNVSLSYRLDGNNVDGEVELVYIAENQIRYNALTEQMTQEFQRFKEVLQ